MFYIILWLIRTLHWPWGLRGRERGSLFPRQPVLNSEVIFNMGEAHWRPDGGSGGVKGA